MQGGHHPREGAVHFGRKKITPKPYPKGEGAYEEEINFLTETHSRHGENVSKSSGKVYSSLRASHFTIFGNDDFFGRLPLATAVHVMEAAEGAKTPDKIAGLGDLL
jgi:hypothetical protein